MKKLLPLLFAASVIAEDNPYQVISDRNAFELMLNQPKAVLPPITDVRKPNLYLTGLTQFKGVRKAHLVLREAGQPDKFVSLKLNEKQNGVELKKILNNSAIISNNGQQQLISFENNGLPTIITKSVKTSKSTVAKKDKKDDKKESKSEKTPAPAGPSIVKVPSRNRGITDPRMQKAMERGLEYVSRIEDPEKKQAMLERIEKFQRGDYDQEIKERMKRYEEYRKSRERKK
tara:strand:+ start:477 stop:1169 length:693 start_codon:yes stop_codon:yes gene_type:complete